MLSHIDTDLVTREQLAWSKRQRQPVPFKPVPHIELIETLERVLRLNQITIRKSSLLCAGMGQPSSEFCNSRIKIRQMVMAALGLRTSNNRTMSIQLCAGLSVFVCDNMVFRGDLIALNRKHTADST